VFPPSAFSLARPFPPSSPLTSTSIFFSSRDEPPPSFCLRRRIFLKSQLFCCAPLQSWDTLTPEQRPFFLVLVKVRCPSYRVPPVPLVPHPVNTPPFFVLLSEFFVPLSFYITLIRLRHHSLLEVEKETPNGELFPTFPFFSLIQTFTSNQLE